MPAPKPEVHPPARARADDAANRSVLELHIAIAFLAAVIGVGEYLTLRIDKESYGYLVKESLIIAGWVALWRPLEIFLYDWWPIHAEAKLLDRLSEMDVRLIDESAPVPGTVVRPTA